MSFIDIYDPKKRNEIVEKHIQMRKKQKNRDNEEHEERVKLEHNRVELFKPILESNMKIHTELVDEKKKLMETLNSFKNIKIEEPEIDNEKDQSIDISDSNISNSDIINPYLQSKIDISNAGYSIRFDKINNKYTLGNKEITFDNNTITINETDYDATEGLIQLLIKKSPDTIIIHDYDIKTYKNMLLCSDALYQGFDKNIRGAKLNSDSSKKWKFIKEHILLPISGSIIPSIISTRIPAPTVFTSSISSTNSDIPSTSAKTGSSIDFLPSDPNSLIDLLRLSIGSYKAGNKDEFNKINIILDELVKMKIILKKDLKNIDANIES